MPIVPANEVTYRRRIRHRLTLDLFTRGGAFWDAITELRDTWEITPIAAIPPEPPFHVESVGLMSRYQMAERFHMPDRNALASVDEAKLRRVYREHGLDGIEEEIRALSARDRRLSVGLFLNSLRDIWKAEVARPHEKTGDWRNGGNVSGWMSWAPFLSACVMYDPPSDKLLEYAKHDDNHASTLPQKTFSQDGDAREAAVLHKVAFRAGDPSAAGRFSETLRESFIESEAPIPRGKRGGPPNDLRDVQCAIWRRCAMSSADIGRYFGWSVQGNDYDPGDPSYFEKSSTADKAIQRGEAKLEERGFQRK